jgi:hypothetical protein
MNLSSEDKMLPKPFRHIQLWESRTLFVGQIVALTALLCSQSIAQEPDARTAQLQQIIADWKARKASVKTAHYQLVGTVTIRKHSMEFGTLPERDHRYTYEHDLLFDFEKHRIRVDRLRQIFDENVRILTPQRKITTFDGTNCRTFLPTDPAAKITSIPGDTPGEFMDNGDNPALFMFDAGDYPIFFAHGLFPLNNGAIDHRGLDTLDIEVLAAAALNGEATVEEENRVVLQTALGNWEFVVDPKRDNVVTRWEQYDDDGILIGLDIEYSTNESGQVLPYKWKKTWFRAGAVANEVEVVASKVETNFAVDDAQFEIRLRPGARAINAEGKRCIVGPDGTLLPLRPLPIPAEKA